MQQTLEKCCQLGQAVIETEAAAVASLGRRIGEDFARACDLLLQCEGRIVVTGMGKSGHIGKKVAATLASTGSPAFFVHPGEANHGDMGMITTRDVVLGLSNSGRTEEMLTILPLIKRLNVPFIALTGDPDSPLAHEATVHLDVSVEKEACPLGLAPTASTTAALVMGDALAVALLETKGFTKEDFALSHPGGSLGRRLLLKIDTIKHCGAEIPAVRSGATVRDALVEMTNKGFGITTILDETGKLIGIYTDGDVRRTMDSQVDIHVTPIDEVMTRGCKTIRDGMLAAEALQMMNQYKITSLVVVDDAGKPTGLLHMHDLLRAGMV